MLESKTFELILRDQDRKPIRSIRLVTGDSNKVITGIITDEGDTVNSRELSDAGYVEVVKAIKDNHELFTIHDIYVPEEYEKKDPCKSFVYFAVDGKKVSIEAENLEACRNRYTDCPQGALLVDVIERIAEILEGEGIDPVFFRFEP
jgi:hypothetical protein